MALKNKYKKEYKEIKVDFLEVCEEMIRNNGTKFDYVMWFYGIRNSLKKKYLKPDGITMPLLHILCVTAHEELYEELFDDPYSVVHYNGGG